MSASWAPLARSARSCADPRRAGLPGRLDALPRLGPLRGPHAGLEGHRRSPVEDAATADWTGIDLALFSAGATASKASPRRLRPRGSRGRQLLRLADGPRRPPRGPRGQRRQLADLPKGIVANPNCTTMVAMAPLAVLDREAGLRPPRRSAPTRPPAAPVSTARPSWRSRSARAPTGRRPSSSTAGPSTSRPRTSSPTTIAFNVIPQAGDFVGDDGETDRGGQAPQRDPQDPRPPGPAGLRHLRAGPRVHRPLAVDQRRVRAPAERRAGHRAPGRRPRRRPDRRPHAARRGGHRSHPRRAGSGRTRRSRTAWPSSSAATTSARAPRSTPSRSPKPSSPAGADNRRRPADGVG